VTGVYGSATVADTDTATVSINVVSGGSTQSSVSSSSSSSGTDTTSGNDKKKDTSIDDGETQVVTSSDALNLTGETERTSNNGNGNSKKKDAYFTDLADDPLRLDLADAADSIA
jgi:hypothetical protein